LTGHTDAIKEVVFRPDGKVIASVSSDGTVRQWPVTMESWVQQACRVAGRNMQEI
jgi:WD40 repeat protein